MHRIKDMCCVHAMVAHFLHSLRLLRQYLPLPLKYCSLWFKKVFRQYCLCEVFPSGDYFKVQLCIFLIERKDRSFVVSAISKVILAIMYQHLCFSSSATAQPEDRFQRKLHKRLENEVDRPFAIFHIKALLLRSRLAISKMDTVKH